MIYVTHDQTEAMTLGNRIAVLNKGKLMQLDSPLHLYKAPANKFVAGFIGSPPMNFMKGTIESTDGYYFVHESGLCRFHLGPEISPSLKIYLDKSILIGIRPEHIFICEETDVSKKVDCTLEIVAFENMGNEQFVYLSAGIQTVIVRRLPLETTEVGKKKSISCAFEKIIYFDVISGLVINREEELVNMSETDYQYLNQS
jgi:multiple sugar transport system ATP-binding protein